jgi:atypical dual specificity phosphatase
MKITWVEPDTLAASGIPLGADDLRSLSEQGIRAIVTLTEQPLTLFRSITQELFVQLDITYLHIAVPDQRPPTLEQAHVMLRFIDLMSARRRPVLVHCYAGVGRTGTALHLYYMGRGMSYDEASAQVRARRLESTLLSPEQRAFLRDFGKGGKL